MHLYRSSMGDLVPGAFPIPQNPILMATGQLHQQTPQGVGDLVAAAFPIPQNPILAATSLDRPKILTPADNRNALMRSLTAAKTGPVSSDIGMGDAASTLQSVGAVFDNSINVGGTDIPYWVLAAGALAVVMYLTGGKSGPNRYSRFKAAH